MRKGKDPERDPDPYLWKPKNVRIRIRFRIPVTSLSRRIPRRPVSISRPGNPPPPPPVSLPRSEGSGCVSTLCCGKRRESDTVPAVRRYTGISGKVMRLPFCLRVPYVLYSYIVSTIVVLWISGSIAVGSGCFWAIRIRILLSTNNISRKNLDFYNFFVTFFDFFYENWCKCTFKK